ARLPQEPLPQRRVPRLGGREQLDRDRPIEPHFPRQVHDPHAATPQLALERVAPGHGGLEREEEGIGGGSGGGHGGVRREGPGASERLGDEAEGTEAAAAPATTAGAAHAGRPQQQAQLAQGAGVRRGLAPLATLGRQRRQREPARGLGAWRGLTGPLGEATGRGAEAAATATPAPAPAAAAAPTTEPKA